MKRKMTMLLVHAGSAVILLAGVILSGITIRQMPIQARKLNGKIDELRQLHDLEQVRTRQQSAVGAFELLSDPTPASLTALTASFLAGAAPDIRARESIELPGGWTLRQVEIACGDVGLDQIPAFLNAAETGRPPWLLTGCDITASRPDGGFGRVVFFMEALSKSTP